MAQWNSAAQPDLDSLRAAACNTASSPMIPLVIRDGGVAATTRTRQSNRGTIHDLDGGIRRTPGRARLALSDLCVLCTIFAACMPCHPTLFESSAGTPDRSA